MDSEPNDETGETGSQSQTGADERPQSKLRDLRPEKDPMGAWGKIAPPVKSSGDAQP